MKFMNMKRVASLVMAGVMTLSLATSAFAADDNTTVVTGTYQEIPIAVEIPTTGAAQINPYKLPVSVAVTGTEQSVNLVGQQITTKPMNIKNQGEVKLDVNASLAVVPTGDVAIANSKGTDDKTMSVSLEVAALNDASLAVTSESETLAGTLIKLFADENTWANAATLAAPAAAQGATTVTPAKSTAAMAVLGASKSSEGIITYGKDSMALFRLVGDLNAEPQASGADDPWKATDGFSATIVFKFTPHEDVDASISLDKTSSALTSGTETLTATFAAGDTNLTVTSWAWATSDATVVNTNTTNTNPTATVAYVGAGSATITVTATLSDNTTRTAQCAYTNT